jgi:protein transport protein SEC31
MYIYMYIYVYIYLYIYMYIYIYIYIYIKGHTEGILSVSWCPSDPSLLLSCGKDNRTVMWDLDSLQPVYDLPSDDIKEKEHAHDEDSNSASRTASAFGGLASSASQRRYYLSTY